jgi:hypothetical protein
VSGVELVGVIALGVAGGVHVVPWLCRQLVKPLWPEPDGHSYFDDYHGRNFDRPRGGGR